MRTFGLLGRNIDYSFSRKYFSKKFENENIDARYQNFDIESIKIFPEILHKNVISGLNVTIPYKVEVIPFLDHLDPHAAKIQAVNTVKFEKDGSLCGYNTDYWGFLEALKPHLEPHHEKALILGTGGASKAVAYALKLLEIDFTFVSRNPQDGQFSYEMLNRDIIESYNLILNSTPLGTFPEVDRHPAIPFENIGKKHLIFDLIYNPSETKLMQLAAQKGAVTVNGLRMLELQAEKAWSIWNS